DFLVRDRIDLNREPFTGLNVHVAKRSAAPSGIKHDALEIAGYGGVDDQAGLLTDGRRLADADFADISDAVVKVQQELPELEQSAKKKVGLTGENLRDRGTALEGFEARESHFGLHQRHEIRVA